MQDNLKIRPMAFEEVKMLVQWAKEEGWNPGVHDAEAFWAADPEGFVVAELEGKIIGGGSIVKYSEHCGFMGLFIVKPEFRGQGLGRQLWYWRRDHLKNRLGPNGTIAMMGVESMQDFYHEGGFKLFASGIRYGGKPQKITPPNKDLVELKNLDFKKVEAFDRQHFGAPRANFLKAWITPLEGKGLALLNDKGNIEAMGVIRLTMNGGFKIGPLFALTASAADQVFRGLVLSAKGEMVYIDPVSNHPEALKWCEGYGLEKQFVCGLMYLGNPMNLPWKQIYGFTSFELG